MYDDISPRLEFWGSTALSKRMETVAHLVVASAKTTSLSASPNPFNPITTLHYNIAAPMHVSLSVYNMMGQQVRVLVDGSQIIGEHTVVWDGKNESGRRVGSDVYLVRLVTGQSVSTQRVALVH